VFSWISNINLLLNLPIQVKGRSTAALVREALMLQARGSCRLLSMVNWVSFWRNAEQLSAFSWLRIVNLKNCRGSSNMVSVVNSFCSLKEFCLLLTVFLHEQNHLCVESPHSSEREKHWSSCKRRLTLQGRGSCVFMGDQHKLWTNSRHTSDLDKNCSFLRESFDVRNKRV
jgi:hypothetical protein